MNLMWVGKGCVIEGSYLWDGVVVGDGCRITQAILADGVVLEEGVRVGRGCILSYGVRCFLNLTLIGLISYFININRLL